MEKPLPNPPREIEVDQYLLTWLQQIPDLIPKMLIYEPIFDLASINANTVSSQTFTLTGIALADNVNANVSFTAGLILLSARPIAANLLELAIWNSTSGSINQASATFNIVTIR